MIFTSNQHKKQLERSEGPTGYQQEQRIPEGGHNRIVNKGYVHIRSSPTQPGAVFYTLHYSAGVRGMSILYFLTDTTQQFGYLKRHAKNHGDKTAHFRELRRKIVVVCVLRGLLTNKITH